jgi:hypothetical protein
MNLTRPDAINTAVLNQILWRDRMGSGPMPAPKHTVFPQKLSREKKRLTRERPRGDSRPWLLPCHPEGSQTIRLVNGLVSRRTPSSLTALADVANTFVYWKSQET